jgi:hypothetical protein
MNVANYDQDIPQESDNYPILIQYHPTNLMWQSHVPIMCPIYTDNACQCTIISNSPNSIQSSFETNIVSK